MFESSAFENIYSALGEGKSFVNVFDAFRQHDRQADVAAAKEELLKGIRETQPTWFDSHPTYSERIAAVDGYPASTEAPDAGSASDLVAGLGEIEEKLTELLTGFVYTNYYAPAEAQ